MTKRVFATITPKEFDNFARKSAISHFQQTSNWANLKAQNGWKPHYIAIKEDEKIIAASLLLEKPLPMHRAMFYAPRGPLVDYKDTELLSFFIRNIQKYAKNHKAIFVKIDPEIVHIERDIDGEIVKNGENNQKIIENLKKLNLKHAGFKKEGNIAPQYAFVLNLKNKTEEEIYNNLKNTHKTRLRQNEKNHVTVRKIAYEELDKFSKIMAHTADRRGFVDRPLSYYQKLWTAMGDDHEIYISEVNLKDYEANLKKEQQELDEKSQKLKSALEKSSHKEKIEKQIKSLGKDQDELKNRFKKLDFYKKSADKNNILTLGALMFLRTNREITSLYGGNYGDFREFNSAYSLNWEMIKKALSEKCPKYNFYGISEFKNQNDPNYGLYDFKKGFGGQVEEYIGEFDIVISKIWYTAYKMCYILPREIRRLKNNKKYARSKKES